jgi:PAS domain S-box-containing protein
MMNRELRILILEDVLTDAELMNEEIKESGMLFTSKHVATKAAFISAVTEFNPDIILSDYALPSFDGLSALKIARGKCPDVPFIFVSGAVGEERAIELLKEGATDYVLKDRLSRLVPAVSRALQEVEKHRELKRVENALKDSEIRYRTIFENTGTATVIVDEHATIVLANRQFEILTGFSRSEIECNKRLTEFIPQDDPDTNNGLGQINRLATILPPGGCEFQMVNRQGETLNVLATIAVIPSTKETVISLLDISNLRKIEREKRDASLYARSLIEASIDPMMTIDADGRIMDVNRAAENITGLSREKLIGSDIAGYFKQSDESGDDYRMIFKEGLVRNYPLAMQHISGQTTKVNYNASLYRNEAGEIQGILAVAHDITSQVEAEKRILASNETLRLLTSELVMTEERERRRIAVDLHDHIGQTLAVTKMKLDALVSEASGCSFKEPLEQARALVNKSIQETRSLMRDISPSVLYELGFTEAIEWLGEQMQSQYGLDVVLEHNLKKSGQIDEEVQLLLFRILRELLMNIVKHAGTKKAYIAIRDLGTNLRITVKDDGIGFDMSRMDHVHKLAGSFGLMSIRERMNYMGGFLEIEAKKGQGTRVHLVVPQEKRKKKDGGIMRQ